ncbi:DEAD/DEAH box helicase [Escherichia coli]|uniref:DEAD/DEAH box helicase n=1 Tax=Escherichia coli TaxID=562 RepID=UPI002FF22337
MHLRKWQATCVEQALIHYENSRHFLCLATPGAGKTTMAAELSRHLLVDDKIDFILCFSPSVAVAEGMRLSMSRVLERRFDGIIGAAGCSYTYQNLLFFKEDFWQLFASHNVMVIFDEIHHCSGTEPDNANAWGEEILLNIQDQATYTLALTGTPWRSDQAPIVLARYADPDNRIQCDYRYGLREAIEDRVCRRPKIVLIDNDLISVYFSSETKSYSSLAELFNQQDIRYGELISHPVAIRHMLSTANQRLRKMREEVPNAAGLVVAASVEHAALITQILATEMNQQAVLVTYKTPDAAAQIEKFRSSDAAWIISVGMISEGTDIPRLQICCHLSLIRTELHYRQVLGRVLRITKTGLQEGWFYTFAEPELVTFAGRIADELPEQRVLIYESHTSNIASSEHICASTPQRTIESTNISWGEKSDASVALTNNDHGIPIADSVQIKLLGRFREKIIATF